MIASDWIKHVQNDSEAKAEFVSTLKGSTIALRRLQEILAEYEADLAAGEIIPGSFENPSWAYKQAFTLGRRAELKRLRDLLSFLEG